MLKVINLNSLSMEDNMCVKRLSWGGLLGVEWVGGLRIRDVRESRVRSV